MRSWTATASFATGLRGVGATNHAVTTQLLARTQTAHATGRKELARLAQTDSQRAAARSVLDSLQRAILDLERATR